MVQQQKWPGLKFFIQWLESKVNYLLQQISCGKNYFKDRIILFLWDAAGNLFPELFFRHKTLTCFSISKSLNLSEVLNPQWNILYPLREEKVGQQRIMVVWISKVTHYPVTNLVKHKLEISRSMRTLALAGWYKRMWGVYRDWNDVIRLRCSTPFPIMTQLKVIIKLKLGFQAKSKYLRLKVFIFCFMRPRQVASVYIRHSLKTNFIHCFSA